MTMMKVLVILLLLPVILVAKPKPNAFEYDIPDLEDDAGPPAPMGEPFKETEEDAFDYILRDNDHIEQLIANGTLRHVLEDGDIYNPIRNDSSRHKRNAVRDRQSLWPGGLVPYVLSPYFQRNSVLAILAGMNRFHEKTCIRFKRRTYEKDYIYIKPAGGCWSLVGRIGGEQTVSLGSTCKTKRGTIMHELMHVLGFRHEHNRPDRDGHVIIYWENIGNHMEENFKKYDYRHVNLLDVGYDFGSIMHYPMYAFSKNGGATLSPRYTTYKEVGFRNDFSDMDVYKINALYKCGVCQDTDHNHCPVWAMGGSCYRNRDWMSKNCAFSCFMCKPNSYGACTDYETGCKSWARSGECERNPKYMEGRCPLSCQACPMDARNMQKEKKDYCHDSTDLCKDWAYWGECTRNKGFMRKKCKFSCSSCKPGDIHPDPWNFFKDTRDCRDRSPHCPKWAEMNQCRYNPVVMRQECKESCGLCPAIPACYDQEDRKQCKRWAWMGECISNPDGIKNLCRKSCGHCGRREGCTNLNKRCLKWAKAGECKKAKTKKFMSKFCAPACGICTPSPEETEINLLGSAGTNTNKASKIAKNKALATTAPQATTAPTTPPPPKPPTEEPPRPAKKNKKNKKKTNKKKNKNKRVSGTRQLRPEGDMLPAVRAKAARKHARKIARARARLEKAQNVTRLMEEKRNNSTEIETIKVTDLTEQNNPLDIQVDPTMEIATSLHEIIAVASVEGQLNPAEEINPVEERINPVLEIQVDPTTEIVTSLHDVIASVEGQINPVEEINPVKKQLNPVQEQFQEEQVDPIEVQVNPVEEQGNPVEEQDNPVQVDFSGKASQVLDDQANHNNSTDGITGTL